MPNRVVETARRVTAVAAAASVTAMLVPPAQSSAYAPYVFDPVVDVAPADGPPGPEYPMKQRFVCATSGQLKGSQFDSIPLDTVWSVPALHGFATGRGQTVAVIDSGVNRNERLPHLFGGGDYILGGDGLQDCDHHGTLVSGIIAASARPTDGFVGIAPDAAILSIRQASDRYQVDRAKIPDNEDVTSVSTTVTLARAIVHAAALNATVINVSATSCVKVSDNVDLHSLAGALYFASVVKNAVVVTSSGNLEGDCAPGAGPDPAHPDDYRGWGSVETLSLPSLFTDFVLSVGGTGLTGDPYVKDMPGPWVGVAAPAVNVVSLDPAQITGELVNARETDKGPDAIAGTSFSAAAVSGLAALIRQRYPQLSAHQVIERIKRTAHTPSQELSALLGSGVVDPMAALTAPIDDNIPYVAPNIPPVDAISAGAVSPKDTLGRDIGMASLGVLLGAAFITTLVAVARRGTKDSS